MTPQQKYEAIRPYLGPTKMALRHLFWAFLALIGALFVIDLGQLVAAPLAVQAGRACLMLALAALAVATVETFVRLAQAADAAGLRNKH